MFLNPKVGLVLTLFGSSWYFSIVECFADLMKHGRIITETKKSLRLETETGMFCWQQHRSAGLMLSCLPPWVMIRPWAVQASQIWQMTWQVANTAGNLLARWVEASTGQPESEVEWWEEDLWIVQDPGCWWRTVSPKCLFSNNTVILLCTVVRQPYHSSSLPLRHQFVTFSVLPHDSGQLSCHFFFCDSASS